MGIARQIQLGIGGSGSILRLPPLTAGSIESTPSGTRPPNPMMPHSLTPTHQPLVDLTTAPLTITPVVPSQLQAVQKQIEANDPSKSKTIWYIIGGLVLVMVLVMVLKR